MKRIYLLLFLFILPGMTLFAETYKEKRTVVFTPSSGKKTHQINPMESVSCPVTFTDPGYPTRKQLRVVGGVKMPAPFQERGEEYFRQAEFLIDDNLDSLTVKNDRYSLYFKGENDPFERHGYYRLSHGVVTPGILKVTLPVKAQGLSVPSDGDFGVEMELFYQKAGRAPDDIYDTPDSVLYFPFPQGTYDFQEITREFTLPDNLSCIYFRVGGTRFSGECWVEAPRLVQQGKQIIDIPFARYDQRDNDYNYWIGCNLSTRSWPLWKLDYNGKTLFEGTVFDRASDVADFYIFLPEDIEKQGEMTLTLLKEPHRAGFPYELRSLEIIEEPARDFEVISVPRYVTKENPFGVLVEVNRPGVSVEVETDGTIVPVQKQISFAETGLHVIQFTAREAKTAYSFLIRQGSREIPLQIAQIVEKENDEVYISSGDEIYIDKVYDHYDYFFKWYIADRIGNFYQFRPSYQWSGFRIADTTVINHYTRLLNQMHIPYAWQVEGRTFAGKRINPPVESLQSPMFRGKQAHENDGGYYYWQHFLYKGVFSDMAARNRPYGGIFARHRPIYTDHGVFIHYDPYEVKDMAYGANRFVSNLAYSKGESSRHTGPSSLFRYFYQAGYEWLGAEQMYGPEEIIMSALRGASRAYGKKDYGSLHAMQWGSHPFTDPKHSLRFYMSLAVAYMHGSSHINTEEALWTDEYMNDRYSESGQAHIRGQHLMRDFIETHSRRGELKSNIAVIQGRNDAWKSFGRTNLWSEKEDKWKFNKATESFDLLNVFYPDNQVDACGPDGWFTSTPYGTIDILPIEAPLEVMKNYQAIVFLGWNTYEKEDFERLKSYVEQGGTLVLSAAHINTELQPDREVKFPREDEVIRNLLGAGYDQFQVKTEIPRGKGSVIYYPQKVYPAEKDIRADYESTLRNLAETFAGKEPAKGWVKPAPSVGFTVWDHSDRRTIYLLNTNWKSDLPDQPAAFVYYDYTFPVTIRQYALETIHCVEGVACMPLSNTTDILDIKKSDNGWKIRVQNAETDQLRIFNGITGKSSIEKLEPGIHELTVQL